MKNSKLEMNGSTNIFTRYNKWVIESSSSSDNYMRLYNPILQWSPYSYTLAIGTTAVRYAISIYQFSDSSLGEEDYSKVVHLRDKFSYGGTQQYTNDITFLNSDRCIECNVRGILDKYIRVYGKNFDFLKATTISETLAVSNDCLYSVDYNGNIYSLTINYDTGNIVKTKLSENNANIFPSFYEPENEKAFFTYDNKHLIIGNFNTSGENKYYIATVDFETTKIEIILETTLEYHIVYPLSSLKNFVIGKTNMSSIMISSETDEKNLIGIKYQGQTFYNYIYNAGRYTAKASDVRTGKTFIGFQGIPETGTMEVTE